jgi:ABC-type Fe3+/spermidine/putrescine transport system ATPase subunit
MANGQELRLAIAEGLSFPCSLEAAKELGANKHALVNVRSEDIDLAREPTAVHTGTPGVVALTTFMGAQERIVVALGSQQVVIERAARDSDNETPIGTPVFLAFEPTKCRIAAEPMPR